jgi:hypothetical protein
MDKHTRIYLVFMGAVILFVLVWSLYEDPTVAELNNLLQDDQIVSSYPYRFRVLRVDNNLAYISSPRDTLFPVYKALGVIFPRLANRAQNNPDLMQAQQRLAEVQKRAKRIVIESGKAERVTWELDRTWLRNRGITP